MTMTGGRRTDPGRHAEVEGPADVHIFFAVLVGFHSVRSDEQGQTHHFQVSNTSAIQKGSLFAVKPEVVSKGTEVVGLPSVSLEPIIGSRFQPNEGQKIVIEKG